MHNKQTKLFKTCLHDLHHAYGAKMVPFAGYSMPVQYPKGILWEHRHTRTKAGLFDVSHMGQIRMPDAGAARELEKLVPADIVNLKAGRQRYTFFTNECGGIMDDLMVTNQGEAGLLLVVNAACKHNDLKWLQQLDTTVEYIDNRALVALQGPKACESLACILPEVANMRFMDAITTQWENQEIWISRSGYTGEDGFELSIPAECATGFCHTLLDQEHVTLIGLGARDSLRLEAGLCLYGHDMDEKTSPIEANLQWAIQKSRRAGGEREGGFPGADRILKELAEGTDKKRCGILPDGRGAMREGTLLFAGAEDADPVGKVTSGCFGPSCERSIAMGYLPSQLTKAGTQIWGEIRGRRVLAETTNLPFYPHQYCR